MSLYKRFALKGALAGVLIAAVTIAGSVLFNGKPVQATDAGDCGPSSIITCGVKNVPEIISKYNTNATVQGTFNAFGISSADLQKLNSKAVLGTVYEDFFDGHDVVVVNNKIVAVNAVTAGRVYVNGSTLLGNFGGVNIYKRPYHLSNHRPKQAFVYMENGQFQFGVLAECGNPITGDTPDITLDKEISKDGVNFKENASFKDGETATFRITVKETNGGFATNVFVKDKIPQGYKYVKGSTKLDGKKVADITDGPVQLGGLTAFQTKVVTFQATVHLIGKECGTNKIPNTAIVNSDQTPPEDDGADGTVTKDCVAKCDSLKGPNNVKEGKTATYKAEATAKNTKVTAYVFSVDGKEVQNSKKDTYEYTAKEKGTHKISVVVKFSNGTEDGGKGACAKEVKTIEEEIPVLVCESLKASKETVKPNEEAVFTAKARAENTKITGYIFKVNGDVVKETNKESENTYNFKNATPGEYTVRVIVKGENGKTDTGENCVKKIVVEQPEVVLNCELLTASKTNVKPNEEVTFTAKAKAKNVKITGYIFNLNGKKVKETNKETENTYVFKSAKAGEYTVRVFVKGDNGKTDTSADCVKTIKVTETPQPVLVCDVLTASKINVKPNEEIVFTGKGTAENTTITGYIFAVNGVVAKETNSASANTYTFKQSAAGEYTVKLTVKGEGGARATNDTTCVKKVTVTEETIPAYSCELLKVTPASLKVNTKTTAEVTFTATNGATFKQASFNFGDGSAPVVVTANANNKANAEHTYTKNGEYTANVTLTFMVNGVEKTVVGSTANGCAQKVVVSDVCKWNPNLPPEDEECFEPCPIPGKEMYPKDDENCRVTTLPRTGNGEMIGLFSVSSLVGAFIYRMRVLRGLR